MVQKQGFWTFEENKVIRFVWNWCKTKVLMVHWHWAILGKNQTGGVEDILFWKPLGIYLFFFTPGNSRQNKAPPLEIPQNSVRSFGNSKGKNQDPWKLHIIFSWSPPPPSPPSPLVFFSGIAHSVKTTCLEKIYFVSYMTLIFGM